MHFVDSGKSQSYSVLVPGFLVKNTYLTLLLCLIGTLALAALPPVDIPDTAFNEMDTPVNLSHPTLPRVAQTTPAVQVRTARQFAWRLDPEESRASLLEPVALVYRPPNLQPLLCTFLI